MTAAAVASWQRLARRIRVPLGFIFAGVFLVLARPTWISLAWSLLGVLPGLLLRGYASGYVRKNLELTTTGPYAWTRNPLYLGSMCIAFGFAGAARSWLLTLLLAALFVAIYIPVIRGEEIFLRAHFPSFADYRRRVPVLLPWRVPQHLGIARGNAGGFATALYRKHREYNACIGVAALYLALALRLLLARGGR